LGFIVLVASFNILASLAMLIQEKAKEIAILKSMGATNQGVMGVFLMLGLFLGLIGALCGTLLGVGCCVLIERLGVPLPTEYYIPTIPVDIHTTDVAAAACSAMLICLLATIYPSIAASRLDPVEGLRHD
jgi:lipoprotein-releasing system permease protein